jgi:hypothetical protein
MIHCCMNQEGSKNLDRGFYARINTEAGRKYRHR